MNITCNISLKPVKFNIYVHGKCKKSYNSLAHEPEIEKYWKPLSWKSNLYFVSPSCFWRNWNVLHFRLELHDRNYWLRPSLTAWLLSSSPIKMSVGQNRTQGISFHTFLSASWEFWIWIVVLSYDRLSWMLLPTLRHMLNPFHFWINQLCRVWADFLIESRSVE